MISGTRHELEKLLTQYCLLGAGTMASAVLFCVLLIIGTSDDGVYSGLPVALLFLGMLWIGGTVLCRHTFVLMRTHMRRRVTGLEFLSTNFAFLLFPLVCLKLRREIKQLQAEGKD